MARFRCTVCNYIYDEEKEGKKFSELPQSWVCPICSAPKSAFEEIGREEKVVEKVEITTTVADKIIEQLAAAGVKFVFGIPGDSNLPLVEAIRKQNKIRFILTRHEETAAFMASAYGKLTGEVAACLSIAGPGATNLITGLVDATTDGAPALALAGQLILPNRQVICITGDGAFAMFMADFTTAVYNRLTVKVIIFNDGMLKNIKKEQEMYGYKAFGIRSIKIKWQCQ